MRALKLAVRKVRFFVVLFCFVLCVFLVSCFFLWLRKMYSRVRSYIFLSQKDKKEQKEFWLFCPPAWVYLAYSRTFCHAGSFVVYRSIPVYPENAGLDEGVCAHLLVVHMLQWWWSRCCCCCAYGREKQRESRGSECWQSACGHASRSDIFYLTRLFVCF